MKSRILIAAQMALALVVAIGCGYFSKKEVVSYSYGTEKVKNEQFIVAFSEGGQLESVSSVKIENEMDGSSTIVSIVEEGSKVKGSKQVQTQAGDTPAALAEKHGVTEDSLRHVNPNLEQAHLFLAEIYDDMGQEQKAVFHMRSAEKISGQKE